MCLSAAACLKVNSFGEPPTLVRVYAIVARLVGNLVHLKSLSAELKHLRHERQALKASVYIESLEDLLLAAHVYPISYT
jgi:hypothetical protein